MWKSLQRFGLKHCDLPTMVQNVGFLLRMQALNIDPRYKNGIPVILYVLTGVCGVSYFYSYLFSVFWFVLLRSQQLGDPVGAMVVLSLGVVSEIAAVMLGNMFFMRKTVREIITQHLDWDSLERVSTRFSANLVKTLRIVKKRAISFWILINANSLIYVLTPFFLPGRHLLEDYFVIYGLEPMFETPNYEIATFLMTACVLSNCFAIGNTVAFFIVITGYSEGRLLALAEEMLNVWDDAVSEYYHKIGIETKNIDIVIGERAKYEINKDINKRLIKLIEEHVTIITVNAKLEKLFKLPVSIGLVCLSVGLCAELLGGFENTYLEIPYTVSQVLVECWAGQKLLDAGEAFTKAVYSCRWENFDRNNMKLVLLMLRASQNTLKLSAGGVSPLSYALAMSIIKSTYSAYTALRTKSN